MQLLLLIPQMQTAADILQRADVDKLAFDFFIGTFLLTLSRDLFDHAAVRKVIANQLT